MLAGKKTSEMNRIVITGAESTGKTQLALFLSNYFNGYYVQEYAREYIENLGRPYSYHDVEYIAKKQLELVNLGIEADNRFMFIDTYFVIIKIWFIEVYGTYPAWLDNYLNLEKVDLFLVCYPDIPWIYDPVRENGGEKRLYLHHKYIKELEKNNLSYEIIRGELDKRSDNAVEIIHSYFK